MGDTGGKPDNEKPDRGAPERETPDRDGDLKAEVDAVLEEFGGDARAAIRALLHDFDALAADARAAVSRGYVRGQFPAPKLVRRADR